MCVTEIAEPDAIVWREETGWCLGYLCDHPDYWTQGEDLEDLREHLRDLEMDLTSGNVPGVGARNDD